MMERNHYVSAGWLIDGTGTGIQKGVLLAISGGLIVSVDTVGETNIDGADIIDFSRSTILPGLVDVHVHLSISGTEDRQKRQNQWNASFNDTSKRISRRIKAMLDHGVVAVRDAGDSHGYALRFKEERLASDSHATQIIVRAAGWAWHAAGRYGRFIGRTPSGEKSLAQSLEECKDNIDHIKILNSGLNSFSVFGKETPPQFSQTSLCEAVKVGNRFGRKTMVHANGKTAVREAIEAGCHSIEHGFFMGDENIRRMAEKKIVWVPTLFTMKAYQRILKQGTMERDGAYKNLEHQIDQISKALECGVDITVGTDSGSPGVRHGYSIREEIALLMHSGLSLEKAIQCATLNGATLLGIADQAGSIRPNMPATFIVIKGGPENLPDALESPEEVFVRGRRVG